MANGIIANQVSAAALAVSADAAQFLPCYLGQAPIWQIDDANWANLAGGVYLIKSIADMKSKIGYALPSSGAINKDFSLSMVAQYHAGVERIFPFIAIVNAATIAKTSTTASLTFVDGKATISSAYVAINSLVLEHDGTTYVKGTDYAAVYSSDGQTVEITAITAITTATATYDLVTSNAISFSADTYDMIDYIGQELGVLPSTLAAPGWENETDSNSTAVQAALAAKAESVVDKHYYVQCFGQLAGNDRAAAISAKASYGSYKMKVCWPWAQIGDYIYPASLVFSAKKQTIDNNNGGIPFESESNEYVNLANLCTSAGSLIKQLESEADALNAVGIATFAFTTAMQWRTWGVCNANYSESDKGNISPNKLNDVAVRMMDYICNDFELRFGNQIHKPVSMRVVNDILNIYESVVRVMISEGQLVHGSIAFEASENSTASLADGQFTFTIEETNIPPAKAIIGNVSYNADALDEYFATAVGGGE